VPKKKVYYPSKSQTKRGPAGPSEPEPERPNLARINLSAAAGQAGLSVGDRVRINASGTHSGEIATIERLISGVIPSALVRTDGGGSRQVRTIDLAAVPKESPAPKESAAVAEEATADS